MNRMHILKTGKNRYVLSKGKNNISQMEIDKEEDVRNLYFIYNVETNPSYRHRGYAYTLLKRVLDSIRSKNNNAVFYLAVSVNNIVAIHLYEKLGFSKCIKFSEDGKNYYCMTTGKGWMLNKIVNMYKHSYTDAIAI